jgi:hypothetical protein
MGAGHFGQLVLMAAAAEILAALCIVVLMGKSLLCGFILSPA